MNSAMSSSPQSILDQILPSEVELANNPAWNGCDSSSMTKWIRRFDVAPKPPTDAVAEGSAAGWHLPRLFVRREQHQQTVGSGRYATEGHLNTYSVDVASRRRA